MRLIQNKDDEPIECESIAIGFVPAMMMVGNPSHRLCPYSVQGLDPRYIKQNLPSDVSYDPKADCGVTGCEYYPK